MKTSIKKLSVIAAAALLITGCNEKDFLNKINPNQPVEETFWTSAANAESAIPTIYSSIRGQMYGYFGAYTGWHTMNRADDVWFILGEEVQNWEPVAFTNTPGTAESDFGRLYNGVNRANVFFKNIGNVKMDESKKNALIGEVSFLRGLYYFYLVSNFGDVPLRLIPAGDEADGAMKGSAPEADVWKQVIADFTTAKNNLPVTRSAAEAGRATKGAAIAFLGKALAYTKDYQNAEKELAALLTAPYTYDLMENFDDNFNENTELNKESVFEILYDGKYPGGNWGNDAGSSMGFVIPNFAGSAGTGGWFKWMPSASIVRDFIAEERPAGSDTRFDKRMYTSFYWKYSDFEPGKTDGKWFGNQDFDLMWSNASGKRQRGEPTYPVINGKNGRFLIKKYTNFWKNVADANSMYDQSNNNNNMRLFRFSEVLLLHAEAAIKNGNLGAAAADLKRIRVRAGLDPNKTWANADAMMSEVVKQNELEFFFEGHRFFDLKRVYTYDQMKQIFVTNGQQGAANFQPKHFYLPIPQSEINANTKIQQNPLWK